MEVLICVAQGKSTKEAATALGLAEKTVGSHRFNIYKKTGAGSALKLVLYGLRAGLVKVEELPEFPVRLAER